MRGTALIACTLPLFSFVSCSESAQETAPDNPEAEGPAGGGNENKASGGSPGLDMVTDGMTQLGSGGAPAGVESRGIQEDPGTEGDGTFEQPAPYNPPPETLNLLAGAPQGMISQSAFYASPGIYPGLTFEYAIYVPAQYDATKPAALMILQDGSHYTGASEAAFNSRTVFDNLIHEGSMPVTIGLFINPGSMSESGIYQYPDEVPIRSMQYDTPSDLYSRFLLEEAIPELVLSQYNVVTDPEGWAIGGHSSGGIAALMAAWYQPDSFRKVLAHNASFPNTEGEFPRAIEAEPNKKPLRVFLLSSTRDINQEQPGSWFDTNNQAAALFEAKGYHYRYMKGTGEHYPPRQAEAVYPDSLRWLWRGYHLPWYE